MDSLSRRINSRYDSLKILIDDLESIIAALRERLRETINDEYQEREFLLERLNAFRLIIIQVSRQLVACDE